MVIVTGINHDMVPYEEYKQNQHKIRLYQTKYTKNVALILQLFNEYSWLRKTLPINCFYIVIQTLVFQFISTIMPINMLLNKSSLKQVKILIDIKQILKLLQIKPFKYHVSF